jgi:hypothetical protein
MSARGSFVTSPGSRSSKLMAESKRQIPLFWLAFLSTDDIDRAEDPGQFLIDRKQAIERASNSLPFFLKLFPEVRLFEEAASSFLDLLRSQRAKTFGIEVTELLEELADEEYADGAYTAGMPKFRDAVEAIESQHADYSLTVPARTVKNPFTKEDQRLEERRFSSTREMLLYICRIHPEELKSKKKEEVQTTIIGFSLEW